MGVRGLAGNTRDWCLNGYVRDIEDRTAVQIEAAAPDDAYRMVRGGCWGAAPDWCRAGGRFVWAPEGTNSMCGFRLGQKPPIASTDAPDRNTMVLMEYGP